MKLSGSGNEIEALKRMIVEIASKEPEISIPLIREATEHELQMAKVYIQDKLEYSHTLVQKYENGSWYLTISGQN